MASQTAATSTYKMETPQVYAHTKVAPVAVSAVTVTTTFVQNDNPSSPQIM